jgi:hypothetical protein
MKETCKSHAMPSLYFCMQCPETDVLCALCVKDHHAKCPDTHIIQSADLKKIIVKSTEIDVGGEFGILAKQAAEQCTAKITHEFNQLKGRVNESLNFVEYVDEDFYSLERIQGLKSQYNISLSKQTGKLCFEPKVYTDNLVTEKVSRNFKTTLQRTVEILASEVEGLHLNIFHCVLDVGRFKIPSGLEMTKLSADSLTRSIKISKKETQGEKAIAYLMTPLSNAFFTITLELDKNKAELESPKGFQIGVCQFGDKFSWESLPLNTEPPASQAIFLSNSGFSANAHRQIGNGLEDSDWADQKAEVHLSFVRLERVSFIGGAGSFRSEFKLKTTGDYFFYVSIENPALSITISE